jgi:hypothetical protein
MAGEPLSPELKASALAMLADGNSTESVASLLGVPVAVVSGWTREPPAVAAPHPPAHATAGASRPSSAAAAGPGGLVRLRALGPLALWLAVCGYFLRETVPYAIDTFAGSPPIERLTRYEGRVQTWGDCHVLGRNVKKEELILAGDSGPATLAIPCVLPSGVLPDGRPHRARVLVADRRGTGTIVYDVQLDGRTLLAYADVKRDQDDGGSLLRGLVPIWLLLAGMTAMVAWTTWRRWPRGGAGS